MSRCYNEAGELVCDEHPDAPHGFNRNASHNEGRYVCDCEYWVPPKCVVYVVMYYEDIWDICSTKEKANEIIEAAGSRYAKGLHIQEWDLE